MKPVVSMSNQETTISSPQLDRCPRESPPEVRLAAAPILETLDPLRTKEMLETMPPKQAAFVLQYAESCQR
jgi:hypothetical protein